MNSHILETVGKRVRIFRNRNNLSIDELSQKCGFHPSSISQIEHGERELTIASVYHLAEGLDVEPHQLLFRDEQRVEEGKRSRVQQIFEGGPKNQETPLGDPDTLLRKWATNQSPRDLT